jgi:hypothetical protein
MPLYRLEVLRTDEEVGSCSDTLESVNLERMVILPLAIKEEICFLKVVS